MRTILRTASIASALVIALTTLTACKKKEAPAPAPAVEAAPMPTAAPAVVVTDVQLGNALTPEKKVVAVMDTFSAKDTIFVTIATSGTSAGATIGVKWSMADGTPVSTDSRSIVPSGTDVTEFSIQKADGWPKGDYKVEVTLDGAPAVTKTFKVS
ncbi:MAG TPA: hypothetical protein VIA29_10760 [Thermoanaerobaculia bacterium]|jgi:hypothetical protein